MRRLGNTKLRKSSGFISYDSFIFFSLSFTTDLFTLKMVVSIAVKPKRKIL